MTKRHAVKEHFVQANGLNFCIQERGPKNAPPLVMIMGLAAQLTLWPDGLLDELARQGYRVICFDNRDIGLSDQIKPHKKTNPVSSFVKYKLGQRFEANYNLYDMAEDTVAIMDALQLDTAHIVGASMGGMIAQIVAAKHRARVESLGLIMTTNNCPKQPLPKWNVFKQFLYGVSVNISNTEKAIKHGVETWKAIQSPLFPMAEEYLRETIQSDYLRSFRPGGMIRQFQAILATGSIHHLLELIAAPTVVVHGEADPLVHPVNGKILAENIHQAKYIPVAGMGHDIPEEFYVFFADIIHKNTQRSAGNLVPMSRKRTNSNKLWPKKQASFA